MAIRKLDNFKAKYGITTESFSVDCINAVKQMDYDGQITGAPHIVTVSLNLPRMRLYITKLKGVNRCIYEYESGNTVTSAHRFSEILFDKDVLLVGYLLNSLFIVEDIHVNRGETTDGLSIDKRLSIVNEIIDQQYTPDPVLETNTIVVKEYVEYEFLHSFYTEHALKQPYAPYINGLIFCPLGPGRNIRITPETEIPLKKPNSRITDHYAERHTIVTCPSATEGIFSVKKSGKPDVYELYLLDKEGVMRYYDIACVPNKEESKKIKQMLLHNGAVVIKCIFNREFGRWMPYERSNRKVNSITHLH
jgi:hypothetical protein